MAALGITDWWTVGWSESLGREPRVVKETLGAQGGCYLPTGRDIFDICNDAEASTARQPEVKGQRVEPSLHLFPHLYNKRTWPRWLRKQSSHQ